MKTSLLTLLIAATLCVSLAIAEFKYDNSRDTPITVDSSVRFPGKAIVTKAECEEVVKALQMMWGQTQPHLESRPAVMLSEAARLRQAADRAEQEEKDRTFALAVLAKWQAKLDAMK